MKEATQGVISTYLPSFNLSDQEHRESESSDVSSIASSEDSETGDINVPEFVEDNSVDEYPIFGTLFGESKSAILDQTEATVNESVFDAE